MSSLHNPPALHTLWEQQACNFDEVPSNYIAPPNIDIPMFSNKEKEKWSPASSAHSGRTECEDGSFDDKHSLRVCAPERAYSKESIGEESSFFNLPPSKECLPLETTATPPGVNLSRNAHNDFNNGFAPHQPQVNVRPTGGATPLARPMGPSAEYERSSANFNAQIPGLHGSTHAGHPHMSHDPHMSHELGRSLDSEALQLQQQQFQQVMMQRRMIQDQFQDPSYPQQYYQRAPPPTRSQVPYQQSYPPRPAYDVPYNIPNPSARIAQHAYSHSSPRGAPRAHQTPSHMGMNTGGMDPFRAGPPVPSMGYAYGAQPSYPTQSNAKIYQVQFKGTVRFFILGSQAPPSTPVGEFVVVEADRGEDVGVVTDILPMKTFIERRYAMKTAVDDEDSTIGRILRVATLAERKVLPEKYHDEQNVVQFCRELAYHTYGLPLMIQDAEYQFDRHKLTIYYQSDSRVDFRELVRDLFSAFKARIWMKKINSHQPFHLDANARVALASGMLLSMEPDAGAGGAY